LIAALHAATQKGDGLQPIFFAAGLCDFLCPKSREATLLAAKKLKMPKTIETDLTARAFVSSFFALRGLDLLRKKSVIPGHVDLLRRQARNSPWRDGALEWLEAALPGKKKPPQDKPTEPAHAEQVSA
jgi:hypothetical protein